MGTFCRTCSRILPNSFVIGMASALYACDAFFVYPNVLMNSSRGFLFTLNMILTTSLFAMWLWCWLTAAVGDPGRTEDDLADRGYLNRIKNGDIPNCIRHLPLCPICSLPQPKHSGHCKTCGHCILRIDHHCGVTGQCVADKNLKGFILSFFYSALYAISMAPIGAYEFFVVQKMEILPLLLMIYGPAFFVLMSIFGVTFLMQAMEELSTADKIGARPQKIALKKFLKSFGSTFTEKIIPYQRHTTKFAWIGVNWDEEDVIPL
ncbi:DHHC zinc finger domain containing protein [Tritrichomonas foetus]|uniref:Palmitoyltransferase n=1 Tax=Tritrichomonas foetus TaxID=1144522 RepID=A0A1J4KV96_9EUKA|nr:DHHC zinc finger domain containing protein [Tritrichomonas foetus]|eukprot:OHT15066.1 DHHC zinc finger domain containing protein [Tritrichomonas foetus]